MTISPTHPPSAPEEQELFVDREARSPLLHWMAHLGVPMSVSLCVHALLFVLLAIGSWNVLREHVSSDFEVEVGVRDTPIDVVGGGLEWDRADGADLFELSAPADVRESLFSQDLPNLLADVVTPNAGSSEAGGFGLGQAGRSGVIGIGSGAGDGGGAGIGHGFGSGEGDSGAGVWGLRAAGKRFAYVCDFSGSIVVAVDELRRELKRSVGRLRPTQSFNVIIFYSTGESDRNLKIVTESFASQLVPGDEANRRTLFRWLDAKRPQGTTEPVPAMRRALALKPEAVFFFSDGYFDESVVGEITRANREVKAQIHAIVFDELLLQDNTGQPRLTSGAERLKRIAELNGGQVKLVTARDFGR